ncbi:uncharacterized protein [Polyergus mexicanus]|uniref:uncharacterized protein n=1 Tax=Polyergus mexicanus TaxID=615972 RepID=UPI0038B576FD
MSSSTAAATPSCCYRCGKPGHLARDCADNVRCPVCSGLGRPADHRVGSARCTPPKKRPNRRRETLPAASAAAGSRPAEPAEGTAAPSDTRKRGAEDSGASSEAPKEKRPPKARPAAATPSAPMAEVEMAEPGGVK